MKRLCTPAWLARHAAAFTLVAAFLGLGWWQISRAAAGNVLSWAYAVEWPVFAGFVVFLWYREVRRTLQQAPDRIPAPEAAEAGAARAGAIEAEAGKTPGIRRPVRTVRATTADHAGSDDDPELADYNRYLRWLNANPGARPADYPG